MNIPVRTLLNILLSCPNNESTALFRKVLEKNYNPDHEIDIDRPLNIYGGPQSVTLLTYFINNDYTDAVRLLLEHGANPNIGQVRGIHCATMRNNPDMIDILAYYGADLDAMDPDGHTALYLSICHNQAAAIACLMEKDIDVNISTPISQAIAQGNLALVQTLTEKGADLSDYRGESLINIAEERGHYDIANYFIEIAGDLVIPE